MNNATINDKALKYLLKPIHPDVVEKLKGMDYIPAHHVITRLNQIFGFDGWQHEVLRCDLVHKEPIEKTGRNGKYHQWQVVYEATTRLTITLKDGHKIIREDVACGDGQVPNVCDALDKARKTAVSNALKRCARTLGNQFGNSLYGNDALRDRQELYLTDQAEEAPKPPKASPPPEPTPAPKPSPAPVAAPGIPTVEQPIRMPPAKPKALEGFNPEADFNASGVYESPSWHHASRRYRATVSEVAKSHKRQQGDLSKKINDHVRAHALVSSSTEMTAGQLVHYAKIIRDVSRRGQLHNWLNEPPPPPQDETSQATAA